MNLKAFIRITATETTASFFRVARWLRYDWFYWLRAEDPVYLLWLLKHKRRFDSAGVPRQCKPAFSILTPAYNTDPAWLAELIESAKRQTLGDWELFIIDDASTDPVSRNALDQLAASDPRISVLHNTQNRGIAASTNFGAEHAQGEWLLLLDHDDLLYPDALATLYASSHNHPQTDVLYADEDRLSPRGFRYRYHFKPAFSPSLLEMCNYILHPMCIRRSAWQAVGGMRSDFDGSQDYDLLLRLWDSGAAIKHVPGILYTWRESRESMAGSACKPHIFSAGKRALKEHLVRRGDSFTSIDDNPETELGDYRIHWQIPTTSSVLVISDEPLSWCPAWQLTQLMLDNKSWSIISAAATVNYDAVIFLDQGVKAEQASIEELIGWCMRADVGVVGGRILDQYDCILRAGLSLTPNKTLRADFYAKPLANYPSARRLRDCLAVDGAIAVAGSKLAILRGTIRTSNGPLSLCLAARARGWRVVYTPFASFRADSLQAPDVAPECCHQLLTTHAIVQDPFTNPYLASTRRNDFRLPLFFSPP